MASISHQPEIEIISAFDGLAPPSASTSAAATSYDIFINHRGPDVKHKLARDIYNALHAMGLKVFLDSEDLQLGDFFPIQLQQAMSRASLHVAIFSPTYAQSPWCLAELSFMLKTGTPIIPVFYQVKPEDLRHGKGIYAASFLEHQQKGRYSIEKLEEWKMALHSVSFYKGESVNNNEEEQRVLKNIVNRVVEIMKIVPLEVAKHPVGLEEVVADFEMTISESAKAHLSVQIVGIWGMGGSGKTTLAKELYNRKYSSVEKSSFLVDVRDAASRNKLHKKQVQLLEDFGFKFSNQPFNSIEHGKGILSSHLRSVRVLIILDDVDHTDQLEALLPAKDSLGSGSLIIVTTREKEVLTQWGISSIYTMKAMNLIQAQQLFCWHVFLQPSPLLGFEDLVEKFISASNGLPLSLKVLGGQLYGCFSKDLWEDVLHKISKILPNDIINRLKVSYDALDEEEKQMFLDVACFFIGEDKMTAIAVWEGSGWSGLCGWERLINKCLVELLNNGRTIRMHDHLRDLGRKIAKAQSPYRLWSPDQIGGIQKQAEIRGMMLNDVRKFSRSLMTTSISLCGFKITRRRHLQGYGLSHKTTRRPLQGYGLKIFVVGESHGNHLHIAKLSRELAWFSCTGIAHRNLPSWMSLKNLRVLELYNSLKIVGLWKDEAEAPVQLRELNISGCPKLQKIPKSIGYLENLKKISWSNVKSLPEEFCRLQSLEHLQLQDCEMLSSLPRCFGHLTNLRHLTLSGSNQLKMLPDTFKQLTLLQHLGLWGCRQLTLQSDILENMTKLEYLRLDGCRQLEELPLHITNQASLSELKLRGTSLRELPINIGQLSKLRVMKIGSYGGCFQMQSLPDSIGSLNLLEGLQLENLEVEYLPKSLKQLINLQTLEIIECPISELDFGRGPSISSLSNLKEICLQKTRVSKISISEDCCPSLKTLRLWCNEHLREVDTLPTAVESIDVMSCKLLRNISGIDGVVNLQRLMLRDCPELNRFPNFDKLASLEVIQVERCKLLRNISGIGGVVNLRWLRLEDCPELDTLPKFGELACLEAFELRCHNKVETIQGLQNCTSLARLEIDCKCWEVPGIESLEHMQRLKSLKLFAKKRSAVEPCIRTIQKWPEEIIICTKAVANAGSLLKSSAFPNLPLLHSFANKKISYPPSVHGISRSSNGNAMMVCLVIKCVSPRMTVRVGWDYIRNRSEYPICTEVEEGKWIWIGVFTQHSRCLTAQNFCTYDPRSNSPYYPRSNSKMNKVEKGVVVRGEEESLAKAFHHLLALLAS